MRLDARGDDAVLLDQQLEDGDDEGGIENVGYEQGEEVLVLRSVNDDDLIGSSSIEMLGTEDQTERMDPPLRVSLWPR